MKARKQENIRFVVKWVVGYTMHFKAYKRDSAAIAFQEYLIEKEGVAPTDVRIVMKAA